MIKGTISGKNIAGRNPKSRWHNGKLFHNLAHDHIIIMTKMFNLDQQQHADCRVETKALALKNTTGDETTESRQRLNITKFPIYDSY